MSDKIKVIDEGTIIEVVQGGNLTIVQVVESGLEIEKLLFIQLSDTPSSYKGAGGKTVTVKDDESGVEFTKTYDSFLSLIDTPNKYDNAANQLVCVNPNGDGLRFINYVVGDLDIEYFTQLADVPSSYKGKGNYILTVTKEEDGIGFSEPDVLIPVQEDVNAGSYKYPQIVVNEKGIITAIQEGKPFEFDPFPENKLLIGDGTPYPKSFDNGLVNQYLTTNSGGELFWNYIDRLISQGRVLVKVSDNGADNTSLLNISNTKTAITIAPQDRQALNIGKGDHEIVLNGQITIPQNKKITAKSGLVINPDTGTVGIGSTVDADTYATRIDKNDFITRHWFEINQREVLTSMIKTPTELLLSQPITFSFPANSTVTEINIQIMSEFNEEATIQIVDSNGQIIYSKDDCPVLDGGELKIFANIPIYDPNFKITVNTYGYSQGQAYIFASYFVEQE